MRWFRISVVVVLILSSLSSTIYAQENGLADALARDIDAGYKTFTSYSNDHLWHRGKVALPSINIIHAHGGIIEVDAGALLMFNGRGSIDNSGIIILHPGVRLGAPLEQRGVGAQTIIKAGAPVIIQNHDVVINGGVLAIEVQSPERYGQIQAIGDGRLQLNTAALRIDGSIPDGMALRIFGPNTLRLPQQTQPGSLETDIRVFSDRHMGAPLRLETDDDGGVLVRAGKVSAASPGDDNKVSAASNGDDNKVSAASPGDDNKVSAASPGDDNKVSAASPGDDNKVSAVSPGGDNKVSAASPGDDNKVSAASNGDDNKVSAASPGDDNKVSAASPGGDNKVSAASPGDDNKVSAASPGDDNKVSAASNGGAPAVTKMVQEAQRVSDPASEQKYPLSSGSTVQGGGQNNIQGKRPVDRPSPRSKSSGLEAAVVSTGGHKAPVLATMDVPSESSATPESVALEKLVGKKELQHISSSLDNIRGTQRQQLVRVLADQISVAPRWMNETLRMLQDGGQSFVYQRLDLRMDSQIGSLKRPAQPVWIASSGALFRTDDGSKGHNISWLIGLDGRFFDDRTVLGAAFHVDNMKINHSGADAFYRTGLTKRLWLYGHHRYGSHYWDGAFSAGHADYRSEHIYLNRTVKAEPSSIDYSATVGWSYPLRHLSQDTILLVPRLFMSWRGATFDRYSEAYAGENSPLRSLNIEDSKSLVIGGQMRLRRSWSISSDDKDHPMTITASINASVGYDTVADETSVQVQFDQAEKSYLIKGDRFSRWLFGAGAQVEATISRRQALRLVYSFSDQWEIKSHAIGLAWRYSF